MFFSETPLFGPGGNSESFTLEGHKSTIEAPGFVEKLGLSAYEYECGKGVRTSDAVLASVGVKAREHHISLSLHAPYFISLSGREQETRLKSLDYIEQSLRAADVLGADTIVVHSGSVGFGTREEAMDLSKDTLTRLVEALGDKYTHISIGIETMGRAGQLGTLEEVLTQCLVCPERFVPVVDFGHLNARECGGQFPDSDSYRAVFDRIGEVLGEKYARYLHCHFSKIEYGKKGELRHLTFSDTVFGPDFEPLAEAIAKEGLCPRIICESAGTQSEDAVAMMQMYLQAKNAL
ncbi:MAG: TIM barrel protein [Clostridia bacterium]|nr:TIM barrel protein [Clostridia bacterium]